MPRIPKLNPRAIHLTDFPQPMYRSAAGEYNRYNPIAAKAYKEDLGLEMVQGPDMPWPLENRRQAMKAAQEAYEAEMAEERARQAYNRRVAAWNSYSELSPRERAFIANQNRLRETLYDYMPSWEANQYARNFYNYEAMPPVKMVPGDKRTLDLDELNGFESFDEFPDNGLVDMPWNRWK